MTRPRILLFAALATASFAQTVDPNLYAGMRWRLVGTLSAAARPPWRRASPAIPAVYYLGTAGSGVWKTVDGGQVWTCVSDSVRLTGIGAVAVAPSRPDTVYVGASGRPNRGTLPLHRWRRALGSCRAPGPRGEFDRDRSA